MTRGTTVKIALSGQLLITKLARANLFQASSAMNAAAKIVIKTAANEQIPMIEIIMPKTIGIIHFKSSNFSTMLSKQKRPKGSDLVDVCRG